jgi:4-aminobutyrate--pyruvate transaminase
VRRLSVPFLKRVRALRDHPLVGEADGVGLLCGIELVADKAAKKNFPADKMVGAMCATFAQEEGLMTRAMLSDRLAFCPPLVISEEEIDLMFDRFARALDKTEAWVRKEGLRG